MQIDQFGRGELGHPRRHRLGGGDVGESGKREKKRCLAAGALEAGALEAGHAEREALALFGREAVDVVVTDLGMPGMTGTALAAELKRLRPVPIVLLTGWRRRLAAEGERRFGAVLRDHVLTSLGPGQLSFDEFVALRMFDRARYAGVDLRRFVGARAMQRIWRRANFRWEFYDVIRNKIAMTASRARSRLRNDRRKSIGRPSRKSITAP